MGVSVSKSKPFQFKPLASIRTDNHNHKVTDYKMNHHQGLSSRMASSSLTNEPKTMKKKKNKKKRTKLEVYRHMGVDDIISGQTDMMMLSNQLSDITSHMNTIDYPLHLSIPLSSSPPPPPPPHKYISVSVKKRAAARSLNNSKSPTPVSFRRRHQRKAVPRHHPNLKLVNTLMIEVPSFRSITAN
ncbi:unnamed protein product [Cunninghamella blakesleeana]